MMGMGECGGARVGAITERTHLSRPAVSHHLQILKEAGLLKMRREGTKNYYYFDADAEAMEQLLQMLPDWFQKGVKAALLAPTAMNQQKFQFILNGSQVSAKAGYGFYTKLDLGIVKYHFELGSGRKI